MNINKQIFIAAIMVTMAVLVGIPTVETQYAEANVNNLDNCGGGGGSGWGNCERGGGGGSGWGSGDGN